MRMKLLCFFMMTAFVSIPLAADSTSQCKGGSYTYDLTTIGQVKFAGSVDRHPIALATLLKDEIRMNHIPTPGSYDFTGVPEDIISIIDNPDKSAGRVALAFYNFDDARIIPEESFIKISYSLIESTVLPESWVSFINETFDLVVVADEYYRDIYTQSGVTKPLFVLPHGIYVEELLEEKVCTSPSVPFVFGCSGAFWPRKNQELLVKAFQEEFGNDPLIRLKLHGRPYQGDECIYAIERRVHELESTNVDIIYGDLPHHEYIQFFKTLDCYVLLSKGEGFSITPREALALGKPTIISNNTAHKTICDAGFVYAVPSNIAQRASWGAGYEFNCDIKDVRQALREVYTNYQTYVQKAQQGREWVKTYLWKNLKKRFMNLIKPKEVRLGEENRVTDDYIRTNSPELYKKYVSMVPSSLQHPYFLEHPETTLHYIE